MKISSETGENSFFYAYYILSFIFIFLPVVVLVAFSFSSAKFPRFPFEMLTLDWYRAVFANEAMVKALLRSLLLGVATGLSTCILGFLAAYNLARYKVRFKAFIQTFLILPMTISYVIIGLGLLIFFSAINIPKSLFAVWLAYTVVFLPIPVGIIYSQLGRHQVNLERAALDLGANTFKTMIYITVPLVFPAIMASFLLTFTLAWDEFIIAFFLCGFEATLPVEIWVRLRSGISPMINAVGTVVIVISMATAFLGVLFLRRRKR